MMVVLIILLIVLTIALVVSLYYLRRFVGYALKYEDGVNNALDILDNSYASISSLLERPLLYDSPEIKFMMTQLQDAKESIVNAASCFVIQNVTEEDEQEEEDKEDAAN